MRSENEEQDGKLLKGLAAAVGEGDEVVDEVGRVVGVAHQQDAESFHHQVAELFLAIHFVRCYGLAHHHHIG